MPDEDEDIAHVIWEAMGELAAASQANVAQSGVMLRFEAIRTERDQECYPPLQPYRDHMSVYERCRPWQQVLMFFVRTQRDHTWTSPAYRFNRHQARAYKQMINAAEDVLNARANPNSSVGRLISNSPPPTITTTTICSDMQAAVLRFCTELLNQTLHSRKTDMALVGALAVSGIGPQGTGFRGPESYPSILSALIKVAHLMVVEFAVAQASSSTSAEYSPCSSACSLDDSGYESEGAPSPKSNPQRVKEMMDQFMVRGTGSPMQWMLDVRAYGMKIDMNTTGEGHVQ